MTRIEQIRKKVKELGQKYFPDEANVWARGNIEAEYVEYACVEMVRWADSSILKRANEINGSSYKRLRNIWKLIKSRCYNTNASCYENYGGRGISVCEEWLNSFLSFAIWAVQNGYDDRLSIDRIDNNGNYTPDNCRWADGFTQANNTTRNHIIGDGTIAQHANKTGINYRTLHNRLTRSEMSLDEAISAKAHNPRVIYQYSLDGQFIAEFSSAKEACDIIGSKSGSGHIHDVCKGKRKTALGYKWSYNKPQ